MRERQPQTSPLENATMKVLVILWDDRRDKYKLFYILNDQFIIVKKKRISLKIASFFYLL